ncbi:hypothetical protein RAD15_37335 [Bradyrhizobium sp. 14AA]
MQRFSALSFAIIISLLIMVAGLLHALKQHPPYAPQINAEQQAHSALKSEEHAKASEPNAPKANEQHGGKHAENSEEDGTEFWPPFLGLKLKITDSLLALFTGGLLVFTGLLWRSTDKLWAAGERQLRLLRKTSITQSRDMQDSIAVARESARAAMKAAETAERALFLEQRPWLNWKFPGALKAYKSGRHIRVDLEAIFENTGKTPAANVLMKARLFNVSNREPVINAGWVHQAEMAQEYKNALFTVTTIMPGKDHGLAASPVIEIAQFLGDEGDKTKPFELYLAFHVGYRMFDGSIIGGATSIYRLSAVVPNVVVTQDRNSENKAVQVEFTIDLFERNKVLPLILIEMPVSRKVT